jgi:hypothetical protein
MSEIPNNVLNPKLYKKAKETANKTYGKKSSAYKSMFIVSTYKKLGGKYSGKKSVKGVDRWDKENWIEITPYLKENKKIVCGSRNINKACRPSKRIDKNTPITINEMLKIHKKEDIIKIAEKKKKNMDLRVNWKTLKIYK